MAAHDIFLSCVSNEFHKDAGPGFISYRDDLASRLRSAGFHVEVQENFSEHGGDLLQKLQDYIQDCRVVIHLVGDMTGACAKADEVHALLQRCPDFLASRPDLRAALGDFSGLSYTQWEALLALHHRRPLLRYQAVPTAPRSPRYLSDPAQKALQQTHWDRLRESGIFPGTFTAQENLALQVFEALNRARLLDGITSSGYHGIHNLPFSTLGTLFKGREQFMSNLRATLTGGVAKAAAIVQGRGGQGARPAAVHALGGVGKTRAAIEYAWQHQGDYDALLFVSAPSPVLLQSSIAALTGPLVLNLPEQAATEQQTQIAAALRWLHQHPRWFLILDNVDSEDARSAVTHMLAHLSQGHVCITSRLSQWPGSVQPLDLQVLSDEAGAAFLLERTQGRRTVTAADESHARDLVQRLDGLALALEQAAAHISRLHLSFPQYLTKLAASAQQVHAWKDATQMDYPHSVAETWLTTFQQLQDDERDLLHVLSWFDPQPIPLWLIADPSSPSDLHPSSFHLHPSRDLLATLADWHLVTFSDDGQSIKLHRLVQEVTLLHITEQQPRARSLAQALQWLDQADLGNPSDVRNWPRWDAVQAHALRLAQHAGQAQQWQPAVRWRNQVARLLNARAFYSAAESVYREAHALAQQHLPPEYDDAVAVLNNLAALLYATNQLAEAEPMFRRALVIDEKSYGPEHPEVATDLNNLAGLLRATNRLSEAEPMYRRALAINEESYGPEHPAVAIRLNNLAELLRATNRLSEAEPMFRRVVQIFEKSYGPEHPNVATSLNNLAELLRATNRLAEAEPMFRRALAIDEKSYGPEHPVVALRLMNLASVLHELGRSGEALPLIQRAVGIFQRSGEQQGYVHPSLATAQEWLEDIQQAVG